MKGQQEMAPMKHGKYVTREIIAESKYPEITAPMARYNGCRGGGDALEAEWSCITKPMVMDQEPEVDPDRDELIMIGSTNIEDGADFRAEVEIALGPKGKKQTITEPVCIYIPKGYAHGPVTVKSLSKPIFVQSSRLAARYSTGWDVKNESDCVTLILRNKPPVDFGPPPGAGPMPPDITAIHPPDTPFRYIRLAFGRGLGYGYVPKDLGWPAKVSPMYATAFYRDYCVSSRCTPIGNRIRSACTSAAIPWISRTSTPTSTSTWARKWNATPWTAAASSIMCLESPTALTKEEWSTSPSSK